MQRTSVFNKTVSQRLDKLSSAQIQRVFSNLSAEHDLLLSIVDSVPTGIVIVDKDFRLLFANKGSKRRLPISMRMEEIRDGRKRLYDCIADFEIKSFLKNCHEKNLSNVSGEFSVRTGGDSVRFMTISLSPLVSAEKLSGSVILVRDITEKRNQEILLRQMENLSSLTSLAAGVAHEIKNPLGAISIHIQLLQKAVRAARQGDGVLPDEKFVEKYLDVVNEEIDNLNEIVVNFLFAVRPVKANLELANPDSLLEKIIEFFTPEFEGKGIQVKTEFRGQDVRVLLDPKLFREAVVNIAQNSIAAIEEKFGGVASSAQGDSAESADGSGGDESGGKADGTRGVFEIRTATENDKFFILINDDGNGMSQKTLERIFEPYYTTKASGTGLGMTTVYKIIKEFAGDIRVKSHEGVGTAFVITLPIPQTQTRLLPYKAGGGEAR